MSRKRKAPKKIAIIDPKYKSAVIPITGPISVQDT